MGTDSPVDGGMLELRPVAVVHNGVSDGAYRGWRDLVSVIEVRPEWEDALHGIEEYSHLEIIFWLDQAHQPTASLIHPQGRSDLPLVGFWATRTPHRPNPLGLTVALLLERRGRTLTVQGLDALDGTPVLDIKPYLTRDLGEVRQPAWVTRLRQD